MIVRKKFAISVLIFGLFLIVYAPLQAEAAMVLTEDNISIGQEELIDDDLYLFGDTVVISGSVLGDAVIFARDVVIDGSIEGSLLAFSQAVRISGTVDGSIRGASNTVFLTGSTGRDLMMAANMIDVSGIINQDYLAAARSSTVTGSVGRNIRATMNRFEVDAPVGGDIFTVVSEFSFGPRAVVEGNVSYISREDAEVDQQAVIIGNIERSDPPVDERAVEPWRRVWRFIRPILSLMFLALLMALIFPGLTVGTAGTIKEQPLLSLGVGALFIFVWPFIAVFLLLTVIGIPAGITSMLLYAALLYISRVFAGYFLADLIFGRNKNIHPVWVALTGALILTLLIKIPYIGWAVNLAAVWFASGAFFVYLKTGTEKEKYRSESE